MKIGIDIDETIAASFLPGLEYFNSATGRNITFEDLTHHNWWEISIDPPIEKTELMNHWKDFENLHPNQENIVPIEGSQEKLRWLCHSGHTLVAITGRTEEYSRSVTLGWINAHFPNTFSDIHFTNNATHYRTDKSSVCKQLGITWMIEDNLDFSLELAENWIGSYLLEKPWNRWRPEAHPLIKRVKQWEDIPLDIA